MTKRDQKPLGFISYSHKDKAWLERLLTFLAPLDRHGELALWDDSKIQHGDAWYQSIRAAMEQARVAFLLVSPDFLASSFCMNDEFPYLVERAEAGGLILLPILVHDCNWQRERWFDSHQMRPAGARALAKLTEADGNTELAAIIGDLAARLDVLQGRKPAAAPRTARPLNEVDITRLPGSGTELFGRKEELAWLDACWRAPATNLASLIAWGGVGKSALVNRWLQGLEKAGWDGAERVFGWSFYSQGSRENSAASADQFIAAALAWFGGSAADQALSLWDKGERLAELIRKKRTLLVLDGLEPLQWASGDTGRIKDPALAALVEALAADNPGLVLITSRMHVTGLEDFAAAAPERDLHRLSREAGRALLRVRGARGGDRELEAMSAAFGDHALAVALLAAWLRDVAPPHRPAVAAIGDLPAVPERERPPRRVLAAFAERFGEGPERQLLRLLGLFDRPASAGELAALRAAPPIPGLTCGLADDGAWSLALQTLRKAGLLAPESAHAPEDLDAHPLVRVHFQDELRDHHAEAWREGNDRLYRYLTGLPKQDQPDTLEELQPLYLAILHGCAAGRPQEVFDEVLRRRIQRSGSYSVTKLGAFGAELAALAAFFDPPWAQPLSVLTAPDRAVLLNQAAFRLRALGRLAEAVAPMRGSVDMAVELKNWSNATSGASSLSELLVSLGRLAEAADAAGHAVELIDRTDDAAWRMASRCTLADARHQRGEAEAAQAQFVEAEAMQRQRQPKYPLLYSLAGYRYCDLLLARGEAAAVRQRAAQTLTIAEQQFGLLSIALDHLSLGRAEAAAGGDPAAARHHLDEAVGGLRRAGQQDYLARGLLARAGFWREQGEVAAARRDLAAARRIAGRGGMRLHLIDCNLEEARLLRDEGRRAEARPLLDAARTAIAETGYHRRDPEVAELERDLGAAAPGPAGDAGGGWRGVLAGLLLRVKTGAARFRAGGR